MKAKGNNALVTLSLAIQPDRLPQRRRWPRNPVTAFALLPFAF